MFNRVQIHIPSGSGGGGRTCVGYASGVSGMKNVRIHNLNGGSSGAENAMSQLDYLTITAITNDVATLQSVSGKTYNEYAFFCSVPSNDNFLTGTGTQPWPTGSAPAHYPLK